MKFKITRNKDNDFTKGLRGFFEYKDLGIEEATKGVILSHIIWVICTHYYMV